MIAVICDIMFVDDDSDEEARYMRELEEENKPADADQPGKLISPATA